MRMRWVVAGMLALAWGLAAGQGRDPDTHFFEPSFGDFREELATARAEGRRGVMVFFESDTCPYCKRMRRTVLNRPEVQRYYRERFRCLTVDVEGDVEVVDFDGTPTIEKAMARRYRVWATPVIAFFDLEGRLVFRYTGATSTPEHFLWLAEYVAEGHYEMMPFLEYKRRKQAGGGS
ncbi:thioredoxin family protein [Inmirania thermothiophila]|uniref:Thioredoxin-related protein n=1 Tax=Inmirania thermothiophila TaxID=1750597 RepID=A0A3N1Y8D7_9GAMM|nr:thioredoxin family protein [Inmirania thermothiophila]ROR35079.1 thioredoxin-related protein [Inmirania thermothiophila]